MILHNAIDHPLLPTMTGLDEEVQWAEYLFHSFILELPLGYNDELVKSFGTCLRWAAEPAGQGMSPATGPILNNHIRSMHRAGAVAASGSGDMVEEVEASEAEVPELVEDASMEVDEDTDEDEDEDDEDEDENEEEEYVEEEDLDRLWPVVSRPLVSAPSPPWFSGED
jgi:hypothetical protein